MIIKVTGAVIKEQGVVFAVVSVKPHVLSNKSEADNLIRQTSFQLFDRMPVVLMAQNGQKVTYYGRDDLSKFLSRVPIDAIPWKEYTFTIN